MAKAGRPRSITGHVARKIFLLAGYGLTDEQISDVFDINIDTLANFKKDPQYSDTIIREKARADEAVVNALYKRAIGYEYVEEFYSEKSEQSVAVTKTMHPDVQAIRFWLKNRQRKVWRDVIQDEGGEGSQRPAMIRVFEQITGREAAAIRQSGDQLDVLLGPDYTAQIKAGTNGNGAPPPPHP